MADFDPSIEAQFLKDAVKGLGTDEETVINVLAHRTSHQRRNIAEAYKAQYGEDLIQRLEKELSGKFEQAVKWSFYSRSQVNAAALRKAMKGAGTKENVLIDVICTSNNSQIRKINKAYEELFGRSLEEDIESETSGDFKRVLVAILQGERGTDCNHEEAQINASELYEAGEEKLGTDESTFTKIMCSKSHEQIRLINQCYEENAGHDLIEAVKKETSGDYEKALCRILQTSMDYYGTIAEILYKSMKGCGTDDDTLIRVLLAHDNDDLGKIERVFNSTYEKTLAEMIEGDTSGDYKRFLLAILD